VKITFCCTQFHTGYRIYPQHACKEVGPSARKEASQASFLNKSPQEMCLLLALYNTVQQCTALHSLIRSHYKLAISLSSIPAPLLGQLSSRPQAALLLRPCGASGLHRRFHHGLLGPDQCCDLPSPPPPPLSLGPNLGAQAQGPFTPGGPRTRAPLRILHIQGAPVAATASICPFSCFSSCPCALSPDLSTPPTPGAPVPVPVTTPAASRLVSAPAPDSASELSHGSRAPWNSQGAHLGCPRPQT